jgi:acyl transferase domain-containing protein
MIFDLQSSIPENRRSKIEDRLANTAITQPALFAVEYALAQLLISWGITPAAMLGHSIGEYVAAALAGVFPLEEACTIVAARGRAMAACEPGAMLALSIPEDAVQPHLNGDLSLAAVNEPGSVVVSGSFPAIEQLKLKLETAGVSVRELHTSHAFHSALMEPALTPFRDAFTQRGLHSPRTPFISNVTGTWITPEQAASPDYWVSQLRSTVKFSAGVQTILSDPECVLLEVGPGTTLTSLARAHTHGGRSVAAMRHPRETTDDRETLLGALGRLWAAGVDVDWDGYWGGALPPKTGLPGYPFEGRRYWITPGAGVLRDTKPARRLPEDWFYLPSWKRMPAAPAQPAGGKNWLIVGEAGDLAAGLEAAGQRVVQVESADSVEFGAFLPDEMIVDGAAVEFGALANLIARLAKSAPAHPVGITILTASLHSVTGAETLNPAAAPLTGLLRVVPQEYPQFTVRNVDVEQYDSSLARRLTAEAAATGGSVIAYRGAHRWVQAFEPYPLPAGNAPIRAGGVYVITGGSGQIGQAIARWLARTAGVRLALISRSAPAAADFESPSTGSGRRLTLAADVADAAQLQAALDTVRAQWGRIDGVFHAAGYLGEGAFAGLHEITPEHVARHLAPKRRGTANLAAALAGHAPDFVALISSLSSILGGLGYAAYAAANACLDAYAAQQGWLSINFDGWGDDGHALTLEEGIDALERILARGLTGQILVSATSLGDRLARWASPSGGGRVPRGDAAARGESLSPHYTAPRSETEQAVARIWGDLLGIAQVGAHDNFFDLGGHSLLAIQAASRLRAALNVDVPVQAFFEAQTVAELAARLAPADEVDALAARMSGLSEEEIRALLEGME